jgi:hypothetical protein
MPATEPGAFRPVGEGQAGKLSGGFSGRHSFSRI